MIRSTRFAVAMLLAAPFAALAETATLTVNGRVLPGTCRMTAATIVLDPIKVSDMRAGPNGLKDGSVQFAGCLAVTRARLSFDGTPYSQFATTWENTATSDPATGVSVALLAGTTGYTYLKHGDTDVPVAITGSGASYAVRAGYYKRSNLAASPGTVSTQITITAAYD